MQLEKHIVYCNIYKCINYKLRWSEEGFKTVHIHWQCNCYLLPTYTNMLKINGPRMDPSPTPLSTSKSKATLMSYLWSFVQYFNNKVYFYLPIKQTIIIGGWRDYWTENHFCKIANSLVSGQYILKLVRKCLIKTKSWKFQKRKVQCYFSLNFF